VDEDRVVVVSHAGVVVANQGVYASLRARGRDVELVVPRRWSNEYARGVVASSAAGLEGHVSAIAVVGRGRPQRHAYLTVASRQLRRRAAGLLVLEEEPFSLAALQWSRGARRAHVDFAVQVAETLDRPMPWPVRRWRREVLGGAAAVLARSPSAAQLAMRWGARGEVAVIPHSVAPVPARATPEGRATVAYVGRLVEAKGLGDLLEAVAALRGRVRLLVAGDGPLRDRVLRAGGDVEYLGPVGHASIGDVYERAHVTCVPSRTTDDWVEQFGRVVVESLLRGVPVVACATGELPWVLGETGGGVLVAERDPGALAEALDELVEHRDRAEALGLEGRAGVLDQFTDDAVAARLDRLLGAISPG
jgi:glycosyltransferase involved in cell wall biosynthesis